jgi:hypothetical protein
MREGFSIVDIANNLKIFKTKEFIRYFVGLEVYSAKDIIAIIKYNYDDCNVQNRDNCNEQNLINNFQKVVNSSILCIGELGQKHLIHFIDFITGSRCLPPEITIKPNVFDSMNRLGLNEFMISDMLKQKGEEFKTWPSFPLCNAATCFNTFTVPYIIDTDDNNCRWTVENCSTSILNVLKDGRYKDVPFDDK